MIEDHLFHVLSILCTSFIVNTYGVMKCISLYKIGEHDTVHQHVLLIVQSQVVKVHWLLKSAECRLKTFEYLSDVGLVESYVDVLSVSLENSVPLSRWMNKVKQYKMLNSHLSRFLWECPRSKFLLTVLWYNENRMF